MRRLRQLFGLLKGNSLLFTVVALLTIFHRITYSYVPLFSELIIRELELYIKPDELIIGTKVNLPSYITNFIKANDTIVEIIVAAILMLILWQLIRYALMFVENTLKGYLTEGVARNLRYKSYDHIQNLSYEYHNNVDSGELIQRVTTDIDTTTNFVSVRLMETIAIITSLIAGAFQMYYINQTIMWVSLSIIPITAIASIIYFRKIDEIYQEVEEKEAKMTVVIQENVNASKIVRAFANESYEVDKLEETNKDYLKAQIKAGNFEALYWGSMDLLMMFQFLIVVLLGIYFSSQNLMDIASISSALMLSGLLIWPVRGLGRIISDYGKALVSAGRLEEIFKVESEYINDGNLEPLINGHIIFNNVSFKFNNTSNYLLKNLNFEILPNETVAIIGKTGSGKTTIINILLKMYDYEGSITIDGVELSEIRKGHLRNNIATVLQDPFLYSNTVYENIKIANHNASSEEVLAAAKTAALDKDIKTFNDGYETIVGERGTTLSGGQKQRVAIARVLVARKPIIIFDDALSALDTKTDKEIRTALSVSGIKQTKIIITHRLITSKEADKVIVINNGKVEAVGTHEQLKNIKGLYQNLWNIQGKLETEFLKMVEVAKQNAWKRWVCFKKGQY